MGLERPQKKAVQALGAISREGGFTARHVPAEPPREGGGEARGRRRARKERGRPCDAETEGAAAARDAEAQAATEA